MVLRASVGRDERVLFVQASEAGLLRNALVILEHDDGGGRRKAQSGWSKHPMRRLMATVRLCSLQTRVRRLSSPQFSSSTSRSYSPRESDEDGFDVLTDEVLLEQFGKRMEKPVVRFLERLHLRDATVAFPGKCCEFGFKLLSPRAPRALNSNGTPNVKRLVLLHPEIRTEFINGQLDKASALKLKDIELHVVYSSNKEQQRRDPILRHFCPTGCSIVWKPETGPVDAALPQLLTPEAEGKDDCETTELEAYDPERFDQLGRSLWFATLSIVMDPDTKLDKQVAVNVTTELQSPEEVDDGSDGGESKMEPEKVKIEDCAQEIGGLVLRETAASCAAP